MPVIDRESPLPLYFQLKQVLLGKIENGEWEPEALVQSEQELQQMYGLSRTTVRQTLAELVNEGKLIRHRGRGTFVAKYARKLTHNPEFRDGLSRDIEEQGLVPGWRILSKEWTNDLPVWVTEAFCLDRVEKALCIRRLRLAGDEAIGYHISYLPETIGRRINLSALESGGSTAYLKHLPEMDHCRYSRVIEAVSASHDEVKLMGGTDGSPLLQIQRTISIDGRVIECLRAKYLGNKFKYQIKDQG